MYTALQIAEFVIDYSIRKNYTCSNLRLQKILYFIQAYFLKIQGTPCFADAIEAWDFGPVVPVVYRRYMYFGAADIFEWEKPRIHFESDRDKEIVEQVVELLAPYTTTQLVKMTQHHFPWLNNYKSKWENRVIPIRDMQTFVDVMAKRKTEKEE